MPSVLHTYDLVLGFEQRSVQIKGFDGDAASHWSSDEVAETSAGRRAG